MINLIPNQEKKKIAKGFYIKLVAVFFIVMAGSLFIASAAILPPYFLSSSSKNLVVDRLSLQKNIPDNTDDKNTLGAVEAVDQKLSIIENVKLRKFLVSESVINPILSLKSADIRIDQLSFQSDLKDKKEVLVGGTASSRESLFAFHEALKRSGAYEEVDLPISNFVKDTNITFSLKLLLLIQP